MTDAELKEFLAAIEQSNKDIWNNPELARRRLVESGIFKENGDLADEYKERDKLR